MKSADANLLTLNRTLLYEQVAERLREFIKEQKLWGRCLPAERDLACRFGVSQGTLRRGLAVLASDGVILGRHGQGTRVLPENVANRRHGGRRVMIVSQWGQVASGYAGSIMTALGIGASEAGWRVSFIDLTKEKSRDALTGKLKAERPDGMLLVSVPDQSFVGELLRVHNVPIVLVDHSFPGLPVTGVRDDSRDGARQVAEHLLELGHRRIAFLDRKNRTENPWRYEGYAGALSRAGLVVDPGLVVSCLTSVDEGCRATGELLNRPDPPTAVMAFDDLRALGAWRAAEERGLEVGRDFAVVGMGGQTLISGLPVELSTLRVDMPAIGRAAVGELAERMEGRQRAAEDILIPAELVVGRSSREAFLNTSSQLLVEAKLQG